MDVTILPAATAAWAIASALAVVVLGILSILGRGSRPPGALAFACFATLWGLQVVAGQWMSFVPEATASRAHLAYLALLVPLPYFIVEFTASHTAASGSTSQWRALRIAAATLAAATAATMVVAPHRLYEGTVTIDAEVHPSWGSLFAPLTIAPFYAALALALLTFDRARSQAPTARTARRYALVAGGLATFTAFSAANNLAFYAIDLVRGQYAAQPIYVVVFSAVSIAALATGLRARRQARFLPSAAARKAAAIVAAAVLVPFAWGAAEGILAALWIPRLNTVGLWRLFGVGLLAYGFALWRLPDLPEATRRIAATSAGVAGATLIGGVTAATLFAVSASPPVALLAAIAVPVATLRPSVQIARRALRIDDAPEPADDSLARRVDTYRAALESSLARDALEEDAPFLAGLRQRLAITPDAHDALLCVARTAVLPPPDALHPGYERLRLVGEGAQGRAWLARRRMDDALVVLKEPPANDPQAAAAIRRQARFAAKLRDPHLVEIQEILETTRGPVLVTEYLPGGSLADRLAAGPLRAEDAVHVAVEVLRGLEALHRHGLAHGDIKAANILLDASGHAKVGDFGLARPYEIDATRTQVGLEGTLSVMAPEQLDGAPATPASDVYAVGALLHRLATGEHYLPLRGIADTEARRRIRDYVPEVTDARVPPTVAAVIRRALAKDPKDRFGCAASMLEALVRSRGQA